MAGHVIRFPQQVSHGVELAAELALIRHPPHAEFDDRFDTIMECRLQVRIPQYRMEQLKEQPRSDGYGIGFVVAAREI